MSVITRVPEPNLWDEIMKDFDQRRPPFKDDDVASIHTILDDFDPAIHNPVFYGKMHEKVAVTETNIPEELDPATTHPAVLGHALVDRPPQSPAPPPKPLPHLKMCSPREYLEAYIFPVLLPALEEMLKQAKTEKCFERKRTKFNGCDFLTEYLYNHNPSHCDRDKVELGDIPFVEEHWKLYPRPPLPKSLLWTEEEATLIIQSHFRGFKVRCDSEIQDLRVWQKEWREENSNIKNKVDDFWAKQMPDGDETNQIDDNQDAEAGEDGEEQEDQEDEDKPGDGNANNVIMMQNVPADELSRPSTELQQTGLSDDQLIDDDTEDPLDYDSDEDDD